MATAAQFALAQMTFQGVFASGGDMATGLLRAFRTTGFAVEFAVQPLVVAGRLTGGRLDGLPFATKGGLIGNPDAVTESVLHLQSMPPATPGPQSGPSRGFRTESLITPDQEVVP